MRATLFIVLASLSTGCATLTATRTDSYTVESSPPGADVRVDGMQAGRTPITVELDKKRQANVEVSAPGYAPQACRARFSPASGYVAADAVMCILLFPIGCIAFIDADGAWNEIDQLGCHVTLQPANAYPAYPAYPPQQYPPQYPPHQPYQPAPPPQQPMTPPPPPPPPL